MKLKLLNENLSIKTGLIVERRITPRDVYDTYAILGTGTEDHFKDYIQNIYVELSDIMYKVVVNRLAGEAHHLIHACERIAKRNIEHNKKVDAMHAGKIECEVCGLKHKGYCSSDSDRVRNLNALRRFRHKKDGITFGVRKINKKYMAKKKRIPPVSRDEFINAGLMPSVYDKLKSIPEVSYDKEMFKQPDVAEITGKLEDEWGTEVAESLTAKEVENAIDFIDFANKFQGIITTTGGGVWYNNWQRLKEIRKLDPILAIDALFGMTHHSGSIGEHIGKKTTWKSEWKGETIYRPQVDVNIIKALNAKHNANTVADFWDKVSPKMRRDINKILWREHGKRITLNKDRRSAQ
jgi:hypothetical protein